MLSVNTHNEWDPLEEVIVGRIFHRSIPRPDRSMLALGDGDGTVDTIAGNRLPEHIVKTTSEELDAFCVQLEALGITVRRPEPLPEGASVRSPFWAADAYPTYCPRDSILAVGDLLIETPMVLRSRFLEPFAYRNLVLEYFSGGARWLSAPKPRLLDDMYSAGRPRGQRLSNTEPCFDAANVLRLGTDLLYLESDFGNEMGRRWLQSIVGDGYRVHGCPNVYSSMHIDTTIVPLRPGLVLLNPTRVNDANMPEILKGWDKIWCPDPVDAPYVPTYMGSSIWIGMNMLMLRPDLAVVDRRQGALIKEIERHGIDVLPLQLTHARTLGGSFHCVTLDIRRAGTLETYS